MKTITPWKGPYEIVLNRFLFIKLMDGFIKTPFRNYIWLVNSLHSSNWNYESIKVLILHVNFYVCKFDCPPVYCRNNVGERLMKFKFLEILSSYWKDFGFFNNA